MSSKKRHMLLQMYKYLIIPLHPPNIYMLKLSPTSTKCTHGVADKLFCRCVRHWPEQAQSSASLADLGLGILQDELRTIRCIDERNSVT
jgi:hypothetical protein